MFEVRSLHLGAAMPTRREATIIIVALVLFLFYFNATAPTEQLTASKGSLQGLRDFVLGPSGPDYSREFGSEFAKSIQAALARWHAHETLQLRDEGSARKVHTNWQDAVPPTRVVTHVPGWTVLDNVVVFKGSIYLVTDDVASFPPLEAISNWWQIHFINTTDARQMFGSYAGSVDGISWLCTDDDKELTRFHLLGLQRLHASISPSAPPARIVLPRPGGPRAPTGMDASLLHYAFPAVNVWLKPEWDDFGDIIRPWAYERVVLVSMGAASAIWGDAVSWAPPLFVPAPDAWWSAVRARVHASLAPPAPADADRPVVVYMTHGRAGLRLGPATRDALIAGLERLARNAGAEVHVLDPGAPALQTFAARAALVARARVLLGTPSPALDDAVFLRPGAALFEFFPPGVMLHEHALPARSMGLDYVAWWGGRSFGAEGLPSAREAVPYVANATLGEDIPLDVDAVLGAISARIAGEL